MVPEHPDIVRERKPVDHWPRVLVAEAMDYVGSGVLDFVDSPVASERNYEAVESAG